MENILVSTNAQKLLSFFARFPDQSFYERELAGKVGISPAGAHRALSALLKEGLLKRTKRGKMYFYALNQDHPLTNPIKTFFLIVSLEPLIKRLKPIARTIILFVSSARDDFSSDSDIDLLIVSPKPDEVEDIVRRHQKGRKMQAIIKTPEEWLALGKSDPVFFSEINQGIILYEKPIHECLFRSNRPSVPGESDHLFRSKSTT